MDPTQEIALALDKAQAHRSTYVGGELFWRHWPAQHSGSVMAPPLILLHGGFGSWNHWIKNVDRLRTYRDVWALDLPGLGRSGDMPLPHTSTHFAEIILAGVNELLGPVQAFALAGFSFGALLGGRLAILAGPRCTRLTLIGAAGFGPLHVQVPLLAPPGAEDSAEESLRIHRENLRRLMLSDPEVIDALAIHAHAENLSLYRFRSRRMAGSNELAEMLPAISARLVGLWGEEDATAGGRAAINAREALIRDAQPDAGFHCLPGVGHWAMYQAPEPVNEILLADL